jgi:hypothetical protein
LLKCWTRDGSSSSSRERAPSEVDGKNEPHKKNSNYPQKRVHDPADDRYDRDNRRRNNLRSSGNHNGPSRIPTQNSARLFASYIEKARADSVRRHASPGAESSVETFGPGTSTYAVTMDFGSGTVETRSFPWRLVYRLKRLLRKCLSTGVAGSRLRGCFKYLVIAFQESSSGRFRIGDITVGEQHFPDQLIPEVAIADVTGDTLSDPIPPPSGSPTPTPDPTLSPPHTPLQRRHLMATAETTGMAAQAMEMVTEMPHPRPLQSQPQRRFQHRLQV